MYLLSFKSKPCLVVFWCSKTALKLAVSRIKLLKNKREAHLKQLKREVAQLLESGQDRTARIRVCYTDPSSCRIFYGFEFRWYLITVMIVWILVCLFTIFGSFGISMYKLSFGLVDYHWYEYFFFLHYRLLFVLK